MLKKYSFPIFIFSCLLSLQTLAQRKEFIYTKDAKPILDRKQMVNNCLKGMNKDRSNSTALSICQCQVDKIDWHFTAKQYRQFTKGGIIDITGLVKSDSVLEKQLNACYTNSGVSVLLQAEGFEKEFIENCKANLQKSTERNLDANKVQRFCSCQLNMVKSKKITDAEMETLSNPNSLLFYEMMYTCGNPFEDNKTLDKGWTSTSANDIKGPESDTIKILTMNGMTYVRIKTGSMIQFWLLDTGAADMLINKDMEETLKDEGLIGNNNYLGTAEYEMANGMIDTCRRYRMNNIQMGGYSLDNIIVAVTDKGKRIIAGKGLLNKFTNWVLNNKENTLVLSK
ncbi:MAG TPA: retroviral-like aspartic protease family protein [Segetibacter sp.]